jgi:hypothetical protein
MKKTLLLTALTLALVFSSGAGAQMMEGSGGHHPKGPESQENYPCRMYPGMMEGYGYGMGPGMMGGYGMGPGMMGGYGWGCGMGPGMMGGYGYGMGLGRMGRHRMHMPGACYGYGYGMGEEGFESPEKYQKFMDETKDLRKKLHDLRFDYREKMRNPKTTMKDKMEMEKEMFDLMQKIQEKAGE